MRHSLLLHSELLRQNRQNAEEPTVISLSRLVFTAAVFLPCFALAQASSIVDGVEAVQRALDSKRADCPNPPPSSAHNRVALKNEICSQRKAWIEGKLANSFSLDEMIAQIKAKNPDVIVLAESHFQPITESYPELIQKLKAAMPEIDCILFEYPPKAQEMVDITARVPKARTVNVIEKIGQVIHRSALLGIKPMAADAKWLWDDLDVYPERMPRGITPGGVVERNQLLAKKITSLRESKQCHKVLTLSGKAHVYQENDLGHPLPRNLKRHGQTYTTINLQNTGANDSVWGDGRKDESWYWKSCADNPKKVTQGFHVFTNDGEPKHLTFHENHGQWSDFDYTLVIGSEK